MLSIFKQIIAVILTGFIAYIIYFGSYLPIRKAQLFITARETPITSIKRFDELYGGALASRSPVGQDEITSRYLEILSEIVREERDKEQPNKALIKRILERAEKWGRPVINRGTGINFSQTIANMASVYREAVIAAREEEYYEKAVALYEFGLKQSPDRQIFLYNLFDIYRFRGDNENARRVGERIIEVYKDKNVLSILEMLQ